jgi:hypothetical protein
MGSGKVTARAEDAQGTPTKSHLSPSILYTNRNDTLPRSPHLRFQARFAFGGAAWHEAPDDVPVPGGDLEHDPDPTGSKPTFLIALICAKRRRFPASAIANQGFPKVDLRTFGGAAWHEAPDDVAVPGGDLEHDPDPTLPF